MSLKQQFRSLGWMQNVKHMVSWDLFHGIWSGFSYDVLFLTTDKFLSIGLFWGVFWKLPAKQCPKIVSSKQLVQTYHLVTMENIINVTLTICALYLVIFKKTTLIYVQKNIRLELSKNKPKNEKYQNTKNNFTTVTNFQRMNRPYQQVHLFF